MRNSCAERPTCFLGGPPAAAHLLRYPHFASHSCLLTILSRLAQLTCRHPCQAARWTHQTLTHHPSALFSRWLVLALWPTVMTQGLGWGCADLPPVCLSELHPACRWRLMSSVPCAKQHAGMVAYKHCEPKQQGCEPFPVLQESLLDMLACPPDNSLQDGLPRRSRGAELLISKVKGIPHLQAVSPS